VPPDGTPAGRHIWFLRNEYFEGTPLVLSNLFTPGTAAPKLDLPIPPTSNWVFVRPFSKIKGVLRGADVAARLDVSESSPFPYTDRNLSSFKATKLGGNQDCFVSGR